MTPNKNGLDTWEDKTDGKRKKPVGIFSKLVYLRKCNIITQAQLAEKLEITQSQLGLIESGRRKPNPQILHKFAEVFDCDVDTLDIDPWTVEMAKR